MATIAELQDALVNADRAGDTQAAQKLADAIVAARSVQTEKPLSVRAGEGVRELGRQFGLTARYGLEGLAGVADIFHEPIRAVVNIGSGDNPRATLSATQMATNLADEVGLPSPIGANERVVGDATRMLAGAGGLAGLAGAGAKATIGTTRAVFNQLAASPGKQAVAAVTAGVSGGAVKEAGGGPLEQFLAALGGGLAGGKMADLGTKGAAALKSALTPQATKLVNADQQIALTLQRQGINWAEVPERVRQSMRAEAAKAINDGSELSPDALRRLLVMQRAGVQPTVGQLTQDPGAITREMNLAKTAANSTDQSLQRLPMLQNQNTATLLGNLDNLGAPNALNPLDAGARVTNALEGVINRNKGEINNLYSAARDTKGRSLPLDGYAFTSRANQLLDDAMIGGALPPGVANTMNKVATGEIPLTVEIAEQLKTQIGKIQRATNDGQARMALGIVRQALDDAPLVPVAKQQSFAGAPSMQDIASRRMVGQNVPRLEGPSGSANAGQQSIDAFNAARAANRQFMNRVESSPALKAVMDGAEPDQFLNRFLVSKQASAGDVRMLRSDLDPQGVQVVRDYLVKHLRDAATNSTDDAVTFGNKAYRKALRDLGDDKLAAFFNADEIRILKDTGEAAKYMQFQPAGSAVNNSNSGALLLGRGLEMLDAVSQKLPLGLRDVISGTIQGQQQRQVLTPANALRLNQPNTGGPNVPMNALLLSPITEKGGEDDKRNKRP
jgi:hypothetical protein